MSCCNKKNISSIERYVEAQNQRTPYDQLMNKVYSPMNDAYHAAPYPTPRTQFDQELEKRLCTCCGNVVPSKP
jgi:hypothetical protein